MLSGDCACAHPRVFGDDPETCHKCGRPVATPISASTWRLALAIAEVYAGRRPVGTKHESS